MKKRTKIIIGAGAGLVLLLIVGGNVAKSRGKALEVQAEAVKRGALVAKVRAPGTIQARNTVKVSATTFGQVRRVAVQEGELVRRGQFLLELDDTQYRAALNEARAFRLSAVARLRLSEANTRRAAAALKRLRALSDRNLVSPQELEAAETEERVQAAERDANREQVSQALQSMRRAQDNLVKTKFYAPMDGVVSQLNIEVGEMAVTGTMNNPGTVLLTISDMRQIEIWADVDEADIVDIAPGQAVKITVDALPDTSFRGLVRDIAASGSRAGLAAQAGEQKTNFTVKVAFADAAPQVKPGMSGDAEVTTATKEAALFVPIQSVVVRKGEELEVRDRRNRRARRDEARADTPKGGAKRAPNDTTGAAERKREREGVFVLGKDRRVEFRDVRLGLAGDTEIEIIGRVEPGEQVVTGPYKTLRTLKNGVKVKVTQTAAEKGKKA